jgi:hypothetical protein
VALGHLGTCQLRSQSPQPRPAVRSESPQRTPVREIQINGLVLPPALVRAIETHRWRRPTALALQRVFREKPSGAVFLDLEAMIARNAAWRAETNPAYFGHADDRSPPGDIDPLRSLVIGEVGTELPFALDYRTSVDSPSVVYLHSGGDRWILVARRIEDLLSRLGLDASSFGRSQVSRP